jgi:hypothetical protein
MPSLIMETLLQSATSSKLITSEGPRSLQYAKMAVSQIKGIFDVEANHVLGLFRRRDNGAERDQLDAGSLGLLPRSRRSHVGGLDHAG